MSLFTRLSRNSVLKSKFSVNSNSLISSASSNSLINNTNSVFNSSSSLFSIARRNYVHHVESDEELRKLLSESKDKLVIVDWWAQWCGPCRAIAPLYEQLSKDYDEKQHKAVFIKADIDQLPEASAEANVQSVPTFHFIKNNELVAEFSGADQKKLKDTIVQHI